MNQSKMNQSKIETIKNSHPIKLWDSVVIVLVVVFCFVAIWSLFGAKGKSVQVWQQGRHVHTLDLEHYHQLQLEVLLGHMTIIVENGQVYISHVDCPDQICLRMGSKDRVNQSIVCSPNNVYLRIVGESDIHL
ncbi:MAG: NusG domain II-containing protein [Clostridiales bacterium]|jgi:hypothetical protein|nr:NusG domain II-containing protein [Clostridiales bacterium]